MAGTSERIAVDAATPRAVPRRKTFELVALEVDGGTYRAHMLNLSLGGACLHSQCALKAWKRVVVDVRGRKLEGRISWVAGDRFGVKFTAPLTAAEVDRIAG